MNKTFGEYVKRQRKAMGYSRWHFAKLTGISPSYLVMIENGHRGPPADSKIVAMAELLGVHRDNMLYLAGKLPDDVQAVIDREPRAVTALIRKHLEDGLFNGKK